MKRSRFSGEQITGMSVADLCRQHGVSDASIYKWKAKFGGMDVSEARRLRALEDENAKLKRMLAAPTTTSNALTPNSAGRRPRASPRPSPRNGPKRRAM